MIKKTITYEDFNGEQQTEDFYFHLSKSELIDIETGVEGGMGNLMANLVKMAEPGPIVKQFREIIVRSYGVRSPDGKKFDKTDELTRDFLASPAFDALFSEIIASEKAAEEFVYGIMPKDLVAQVQNSAQDVQLPAGDGIQGTVSEEPAWIREGRDPTPAEVRTMSQSQLMAAYQKKMSS